MNIKEYRKILNSKLAQRDLLKKQKKKKNSQLLDDKNKYQILIETQEVIQEVARQTQNEIKIHISDIVNLAIDSIPFEEKPDYFDIEFVIRRNQTECDLFYVQNNKKMNPVQSSGGGLLDITSFGLKIACWSLQVNEKNNTIILDEPFKNINDPGKKLGLMECICEMVKKISDKLNIQFIIVGMNDDFVDIADRVFLCKLENKESKIKKIK
ncbi:MAG: hypothetical protein ACYS76_09725 [Planctomycetota bacterium]